MTVPYLGDNFCLIVIKPLLLILLHHTVNFVALYVHVLYIFTHIHTHTNIYKQFKIVFLLSFCLFRE
uniref:Uncharacterized protein n=1 Tax=Anguilla anguilla TaxID=7936 RepID=A0A0E9TJI1_ANGAN